MSRIYVEDYMKDTMGIDIEKVLEKLDKFQDAFNNEVQKDNRKGLNAGEILKIFNEHEFTREELVLAIALTEVRHMAVEQDPQMVKEYGLPSQPTRELFSFCKMLQEKNEKPVVED